MTKKQITTNPFDLENVTNETASDRRIEMTPQLVGLSNTRATEIIRFVGNNPETFSLAEAVKNEGKAEDLFKLIETCVDETKFQDDVQEFTGLEDSIYDRLLESRRSDRSKTKSKGLNQMKNLHSFISAGYAEMLVRAAWNKPYQATGTEINMNDLASDQDALNRKIRSLQSKQTRLGKTAPFVPEDARALEEVRNEIERLKSLRVGSGQVSSKTVVKNLDVDLLREALAKVDTKGMDAEQAAKIEALMSQLAK